MSNKSGGKEDAHLEEGGLGVQNKGITGELFVCRGGEGRSTPVNTGNLGAQLNP